MIELSFALICTNLLKVILANFFIFLFADTPVLVHGDNGVDMTLVITSLVQVLLDPECRTIRG